MTRLIAFLGWLGNACWILGCLCLLGATFGLVFGPTTAYAAADDGSMQVAWWLQLLIAAAGAFGTGLMALLGRLANKGFDWLAQKTKLGFLANVDEVLMGYVQALFVDEVRAAKEAAADGKLTKEEQKRFKDLVVQRAKQYFSFEQLAGVFGASNVVAELGAHTEKVLAVAKNEGKKAAGIREAGAKAASVPSSG